MTDTPPPRLLYLVTEDWYFWSHRLPMARAARAAGFEVAVATRVTAHGARIEAEGFRLYPLPWQRRNNGPLALLASVRTVAAIYRAFRPDLVHHIAMKPVMLGAIAARLAGVPRVVSGIMGLGYLFVAQSTRARILRRVVGYCLRLLLDRPGQVVVVQNEDDRTTLCRAGVVADDRFALIRGSGIDLTGLPVQPDPPAPPVVAAYVGRMLEDKGVRPLLAAQQALQGRGVDLRLLLVGATDPDNPTAIPENELAAWNQLPGVSWLGHRNDIAAVWAQAHIAVLMSRREGLPRTLLEAAAAGRPIVASDVPGCREIARAGLNALLVPADDAAGLAEALATLAADPDLRRRFGAAGRDLVETGGFSAQAIGAETVRVYRELLGREAN